MDRLTWLFWLQAWLDLGVQSVPSGLCSGVCSAGSASPGGGFTAAGSHFPPLTFGFREETASVTCTEVSGTVSAVAQTGLGWACDLVPMAFLPLESSRESGGAQGGTTTGPPGGVWEGGHL